MDATSSPLLQRFADVVCRVFPRGQPQAAFLDVGCGSGALLRACSQRGITGVGVEPDRETATCAASQAMPVVCASAERLPWRDGSFPVVTMRHVPHHLERPEICFAEALRVTAEHLIIAEPIFDPLCPGQDHGQAADRLLKRLDRARGMFHADCMAPAQLLELVGDVHGTSQVESLIPLEPWTSEDLEQRLHEALGPLTMEPGNARERDRLIRLAQQGQVTRNGTAILSIQKTPFR